MEMWLAELVENWVAAVQTLSIVAEWYPLLNARYVSNTYVR
jgi:hypothetical protein